MTKLKFDPPLKPFEYFYSTERLEPILCPACGSLNVKAYARVYARAWVNLNTYECEDPDDVEADSQQAREDEDERTCFDCNYEWEVSESDNQD